MCPYIAEIFNSRVSRILLIYYFARSFKSLTRLLHELYSTQSYLPLLIASFSINDVNGNDSATILEYDRSGEEK